MAESKRRRIEAIYRRLSQRYGVPRWARSGPATDVLIHTILSQNTNDRNSAEGFRRLKERFGDWGDVERAHWKTVEATIRVSGLANIKSRRIRSILRGIREERDNYSLEFLKRLPASEANNYLRKIPGVGPKTAACVLVFSFGMPVFPVDTHVHRVSQRLGLIPEKMNAEKAHQALQEAVPDGRVYPFHMLLIRHGRDTCHARKPACGTCVLRAICPYWKKNKDGRRRTADCGQQTTDRRR